MDEDKKNTPPFLLWRIFFPFFLSGLWDRERLKKWQKKLQQQHLSVPPPSVCVYVALGKIECCISFYNNFLPFSTLLRKFQTYDIWWLISRRRKKAFELIQPDPLSGAKEKERKKGAADWMISPRSSSKKSFFDKKLFFIPRKVIADRKIDFPKKEARKSLNDLMFLFGRRTRRKRE